MLSVIVFFGYKELWLLNWQPSLCQEESTCLTSLVKLRQPFGRSSLDIEPEIEWTYACNDVDEGIVLNQEIERVQEEVKKSCSKMKKALESIKILLSFPDSYCSDDSKVLLDSLYRNLRSIEVSLCDSSFLKVVNNNEREKELKKILRQIDAGNYVSSRKSNMKRPPDRSLIRKMSADTVYSISDVAMLLECSYAVVLKRFGHLKRYRDEKDSLGFLGKDLIDFVNGRG